MLEINKNISGIYTMMNIDEYKEFINHTPLITGIIFCDDFGKFTILTC